MKARLIEKNGEKLRVSINDRTRVATFTTYFRDGTMCCKYRAKLDREDMQYYPDYATTNDWFRLFHNSECTMVL